MEVPTDYVINIMSKTLDIRIDSLEKKIDYNHLELKADILEIKKEISKFQEKCSLDMTIIDKRIKDYEQFKYKVYAYSGAIAVASGVMAKIILS